MTASNAYKLVISAGRDAKIYAWKMHDEGKQIIYAGHGLTVTAIDLDAVVADSPRMLVSGSRDAQVCLWDLLSGKQVHSAKIERNLVTDIRWIPNSHCFAQTSEDLTLRIWDSRTCKPVQTIQSGSDIQVCLCIYIGINTNRLVAFHLLMVIPFTLEAKDFQKQRAIFSLSTGRWAK